jgi:hypothetical protein
VHVVAIHRINDPQGFQEAIQRETGGGPPPGGFELPLQLVAEDGKTQVCLWDGPSVEAVKELVDDTVGEFAENEVFGAEIISAQRSEAESD